MKVHEYQAKKIFHAFGIPVPRGIVTQSAEEAQGAARELGGELFAVKAQVHAGGRGKGGGVKLAKSVDEVRTAAEAMIGKPLVTHQTGPEGVIVRTVLVEQGCPFERQFYVGIVLDRAAEAPVVMVSQEGGVEIEKVAREKPAAIVKRHFDPRRGLADAAAAELAEQLGLSGAQAVQAGMIMQALARIYLERDCSLIEINPLVLSKQGEVVAIDAKINLDDNALFRHEELQAMRDRSEEDPREAEAADYGFSYVSLDGDIGCMVNGAGLAMATNDIITHAGGSPANFLDVGGAADPERVTNAFKLLLGDPRVKTVLVNIFGGIVKCDVIANGIVAALQSVPLTVPMVVRLEGTNVDDGRRILRESGHPLIEADDFADAARKAVAAARGELQPTKGGAA
ncbi:MAG: ADP-forming succinate--CoA ligase subunit beta [Candidatus Eisenbacteria bacterium]|nr:ADP-forming succinate--CoA ligase subunit beta [Candidatus Eisenbacteria bacterium]